MGKFRRLQNMLGSARFLVVFENFRRMTRFDKEFERLGKNSQAFAHAQMTDKKIASHKSFREESA